MKINICHLYPDILNFYGDRGNVICLSQRLIWRGIETEIHRVNAGEKADFSSYDVVFMGGGQDYEYGILEEDLRANKAEDIRAAVEDGACFLCVCGGYQMMGQSFETSMGHKYECIRALPVYTVQGAKRFVGNFSFTTQFGEVIGFENHSGKTYLEGDCKALGEVISGFGNNGEDRTEGALYKNTFCTYSHGPVLPKNPSLADEILRRVILKKYGKAELEPLDDSMEQKAHNFAKGAYFV